MPQRLPWLRAWRFVMAALGRSCGSRMSNNLSVPKLESGSKIQGNLSLPLTLFEVPLEALLDLLATVEFFDSVPSLSASSLSLSLPLESGSKFFKPKSFCVLLKIRSKNSNTLTASARERTPSLLDLSSSCSCATRTTPSNRRVMKLALFL